MSRMVCISAMVAGTVAVSTEESRAEWSHFARGTQRISLADRLPTSVAQPQWILTDASTGPIEFIGQSGIIAADGRIFAVGRIAGQAHIIAASAGDGELEWKAPVASGHMESWSTPAFDSVNNTIIVGSGNEVTAFDAASGALRWRRELARNIVNASPLVTADLAANRLFITDYDGFGPAGQLYCINIDPYDAQENPYQPGEIVWSVTLGSTSGNTPAYHNGVVYVASVADETGLSAGVVRAFPADAVQPPSPLWVFENPEPHGFFGGVAVRPDGAQVSLFVASYALYGGQFAANMVKIDSATGQLVWSIPTNRTDATPIPLPDDRIVLSGGIHGFGSIPSVQLFEDQGQTVKPLWDSALDSWIDQNSNGVMDPGEYLVVGGWTHQPVAAHTPSGTFLLVGAIAPNSLSACTDLYLLDLDRLPRDSGFVIEHFAGAGSTPGAAGEQVFTIGASGIHAFGHSACWANCDHSTTEPLLTVDDFTCFINHFAEALSLPVHEQIAHYANCDGSTTEPVLTVDDFTCFIDKFAAGCP